MSDNIFVVTIDGPAGSGKGTLANIIKNKYHFAYLDTGKIYRACGYHLLQQNIDINHHDAIVNVSSNLPMDDLQNPVLMQDNIAQIASIIATIPEVRESLLQCQRNFITEQGKTHHGVVLDGRDCGTVIYPHAAVKFFLDADVEKRAIRRFQQLHDNDDNDIQEKILNDLKERDYRDRHRAQAPLKPADDAIIIDSTDLSIDIVVQKACDIIDAARKL